MGRDAECLKMLRTRMTCRRSENYYYYYCFDGNDANAEVTIVEHGINLGVTQGNYVTPTLSCYF